MYRKKKTTVLSCLLLASTPTSLSSTCYAGYSSGATCTLCPSGTYNGVAGGSCSSCPANSTSALSGAISCTCSQHQDPYTYGSNLLCYNCPAGKTPSKTCPPGYTYASGGDSNGYYDGCYMYVQSFVSWYAAVTACNAAYGGWLVAIDNYNENQYVYSLGGTTYTKWIGFNDLTGTYDNVYRESATYSNWGFGQPNYATFNGEVEHCAQILGTETGLTTYNGNWNDATCGSTNFWGAAGHWSCAFVCENNAINYCPSDPSPQPSARPTTPSSQPSSQPSYLPSSQPSSQPSYLPSSQPSSQPLSPPSSSPSSLPSSQPSSEPTSDPSSQPSSRPTAEPTKLDVLNLNPLSTSWNSRYSLFKLEHYLLWYLLYFIAWFLVMYTLDKTGVADKYITLLLKSSYLTAVYYVVEAVGTQKGTSIKGKRLFLLNSKNNAIKYNKHLFVVDKDSLLQSSQDAAHSSRMVVGRDGSASTRVNPMFNFNRQASTMLYDQFFSGRASTAKNEKLGSHTGLRIFYDYIADRRTYLGCRDVLFPGGFKAPFTATVMSKGLMEDYMLYVLNNHNILSCSFCAKGSTSTRRVRRIVWAVQHSVGFVLLAFSESALGLLGVPDSHISYVKPLWNMIAVRGAVVSIKSSLPKAYANISGWTAYSVTAFFAVLVIIILCLAALLTPPNVSRGYVILRYFLQVHLYSFFLEMFIFALRFRTDFYLGVHLGLLQPIDIGSFVCEVIVIRHLVEGVHYKHHYYRLCGGLLTIEYIVLVVSAYDSQENIVATSSKHSIATTRLIRTQTGRIITTELNPMMLLKKQKKEGCQREVREEGIDVEDPTPLAMEVDAPVYDVKPQPLIELMPVETPVVDDIDVEEHVAPVDDIKPLPFPPHVTDPMQPTDDERDCEEPLIELVPVKSAVVDDIDVEEQQEQSDRDRTYGDNEEMEDLTISLKTFRPEVRKDYKDNFHFWQARMKGYIDSQSVEQSDIQSLQKAATTEGKW